MAGGGVTTHVINIQVQGADKLKDMEKGAKGAGDALDGISKGGASKFAAVAQGAEKTVQTIAGIVSQAFDAAKALADMAKEGAKLQTLDAAFKALGGNAKELSKLQSLTGGLVSDEDLQQASNLAKLFKLPADEIPKLIKLAQGASAALGTTVAKAISDTFTAASRQSKMIADNMGIVIGDMKVMYQDFAKAHGKTVDQLTDKDKQLAFVQKMVAEGGRQMELATIGQGNAALKAEAQMANFERTLKMGVADAFATSGAFEMMGGVLSTLQAALAENAGALTDLVMPAFKSVMDLAIPLGTVFASLLPLLEPVAKLFSLLGAVLTGLAPVIGLVTTVVAKLSAFIIDVIFIALQPLLAVAGEVAGVFDDDLAASLNRAAEMIDKAGVATEASVIGLQNEGKAAEAGARSWDLYAAARADALQKSVAHTSIYSRTGSDAEFAASLGVSPEQLDAIGADMETFQRQHLERVAYMAGAFSQADLAKMSKEQLHQVAAESGKTQVQLQKIAQDSLKLNAENAAARLGIEGVAAKGVEKIILRNIDKETAAIKAAAQEKLDISVRAIAEMDRIQTATTESGVDMLSSAVWENASSTSDALKAIDDYYDAHLEHIRAVYGETSEVALLKEAQLAAMVEAATEAQAKDDKPSKRGGGGGKAPDWFAAEWDARLQLMTEQQQKEASTQAQYESQISALHTDQIDLRMSLTMKMFDELDAAETAYQAERVAAQMKLSEFISGESDGYSSRIAAIRAEAEGMKAMAQSLGMGDAATMAGIDAATAKREGAEGPQVMGGVTASIDAMSEAMAAYRGNAQERMNEVEAETAAHTERMAGLFQGMGLAMTDAFMRMAAGGADLRETMFQLMGSMFGQLSTAFLAWASAESSLLLGNPFGAAAAAIALGVVGSAISAFGSRGKSSGAKGGSAPTSRKALESKQDKKEAQTVIYNYGFATPDSIARSVSRGDLRGKDLRGREKV